MNSLITAGPRWCRDSGCLPELYRVPLLKCCRQVLVELTYVQWNPDPNPGFYWMYLEAVPERTRSTYATMTYAIIIVQPRCIFSEHQSQQEAESKCS